MSPTHHHYDAFISYSHAVDAELSAVLQRGLVQFAKPWYQRRALNVFRDDTGLATNPDLWHSVVDALDASTWFVLLASPASVQSEWVQRELQHWLQTKGPLQVLPVVTGGTWSWTSSLGAPDPMSAVPAILRAASASEPRHLDLRWARNRADLDLRNGFFRSAVADLASPMHGVAKEDLEGEDFRQHRRTVRTVRTAIGVLAILLTIAIVSAGFALSQRNEARTQARIADAHRIAAQAVASAPADLSRSLLLSLAALHLSNDSETRGALLTLVQQGQAVQRIMHGSWRAAAVTRDGSAVYAIGASTITRLDLRTFHTTTLAHGPPPDPRCIDVSPDGRYLAVGGPTSVYLLDASTGAIVGSPLSIRVLNSIEPAAAVRFSPDGSVLAEIDEGGRGLVWSTTTREALGWFINGESSDAQPSIDFSQDSQWFTSPGSPGLVYNSQTVEPRYAQQILGLPANDVDLAVRFSPEGDRIAVSDQSDVSFRDPSTGAPLGPVIPTGGSPVIRLAYSPDATVVAGARTDGSITLWNTVTGEPEGGPLIGASRAPLDLAFTSGDDSIVEVTPKEVVMFDTIQTFGAQILGGSEGESSAQINSLTLNPNGTLMAASEGSGDVDVWEATSGATTAQIVTGDAGSGVWSSLFIGSGTIAIAGDEGTVSFWNARSGELQRRPIVLTDPALTNISTTGVGVGALVRDEKTKTILALTGAGSLVSIAQSSGRVLTSTTVEPRLTPPIRLAIRPDDAQLAITGPNGVDLESLSGHLEHALDVGAVGSLAYSPSGRKLAIGLQDGELLLVDSAHPTLEVPPLVANRGAVWSLAFSPTGDVLAAGGQDGSVTLWDVATRTTLGPALQSQVGDVSALLFAHHGTEVLAGAADGTVVGYDISNQWLIDRACTLANSNLTEAEWTQYIGAYPFHLTCTAR